MFTYPDVDAFKSYFSRDFSFDADPALGITDTDIQKGLDEAEFTVPQGLFDVQAAFNVGFLLFSAHCMVINIKNSGQGASGQFDWNVISKSVGSVSQSSQIPEEISKDPNFSYYTRTNYGAKYLIMVLPAMRGNVGIACGGTQP